MSERQKSVDHMALACAVQFAASAARADNAADTQLQLEEILVDLLADGGNGHGIISAFSDAWLYQKAALHVARTDVEKPSGLMSVERSAVLVARQRQIVSQMMAAGLIKASSLAQELLLAFERSHSLRCGHARLLQD